MGDCLLAFVGDPAIATFGGSDGMGDDITIISGPKRIRENVPGCIRYLHSLINSKMACHKTELPFSAKYGRRTTLYPDIIGIIDISPVSDEEVPLEISDPISIPGTHFTTRLKHIALRNLNY